MSPRRSRSLSRFSTGRSTLRLKNARSSAPADAVVGMAGTETALAPAPGDVVLVDLWAVGAKWKRSPNLATRCDMKCPAGRDRGPSKLQHRGGIAESRR